MRVVVASILAVLLIGGTVAAQSPSVAPAPSVPPAASPGVPVTPGTGPALEVAIRNAKACKAGTTCTWYLTIIDPVASTASVTQLVQGTAKRVLNPATPLPTNLAPGIYLLEASAWTAGVPTDGSKVPTGRTASCAMVLTVPADPAITTLNLQVQFKKKQRGCEITSAAPIPSTPGPTAASPVPSVAP